MTNTLTPKEVSKILQVTDHTLRRWRMRGKGPPWRHVEGSIRYISEEVQRWLDARPGRTT
ncbi:MAG: helix-turn-helix domain-containing protein [Chloroflexota bacterium]